MTLPIDLPSEFLEGIKEISIDASSIIYLLKIGLLGYTAAEIDLFSSQRIIEEVGWPHLPVTSFYIKDENLSNDETVVALAVSRHISVLSEDHQVLKNAESNGLNFYNTLMILNYLLLKKRIEIGEYPEYLRRLIEISHYSQDILDYGDSIKQLVLQRLKETKNTES